MSLWTGRRRFHLQLTPLLDLLLIVIFAQYLDVQQQARRQSVEVEQQAEARERELTRRYATLEANLTNERQVLARERESLTSREQEAARRVEQISQQLEDVLEQQRRAADVVAELFNVPQELIEETLKPQPAGAPPRTPAELERLRQEFRDLAALRGPEVIEHLLSYDELRKRADVWTIRVRANGEIVFAAQDQSQSFRATTSSDFATRLYERYKTLPQPKGLVVLLISYGDARADVRQAVLNGLPEAVRLMRDDRLGRTQFEYAILGFIPEEQ